MFLLQKTQGFGVRPLLYASTKYLMTVLSNSSVRLSTCNGIPIRLAASAAESASLSAPCMTKCIPHGSKPLCFSNTVQTALSTPPLRATSTRLSKAYHLVEAMLCPDHRFIGENDLISSFTCNGIIYVSERCQLHVLADKLA